jgi:2,6-dihydroxypseudooxynicotine hydrolase
MADRQVEIAVANWAPRFIHNGVDYTDFVASTARCESWDGWLDAWTETADGAARIAERAEEEGHPVTAGMAWRRAAVCRHFGKFVWLLDADRHAQETLRAAEEMSRALAILDPTWERVEAPLEGHHVVGNLRRPRGVERPPLALLIPGLDSTKEEFFFLEESFLARGIATLSIDGSGQGEVGLDLPIRHDFEVATKPLLDAVAGRDDIDFARLAIVGVSLGGYYAPRVAAFESRARAVVGVAGPYAFDEIWDELPPMSKLTFSTKAHAGDEAEAREIGRTLDLAGVCERIEIPALYVTGKLDRLVPWEQTERMAKESPRGEFTLYEEGNHGCSNNSNVARPAIADWVRDRLDEVRMQSSAMT